VSTQQDNRFRPKYEVLEDRCVLSTGVLAQPFQTAGPPPAATVRIQPTVDVISSVAHPMSDAQPADYAMGFLRGSWEQTPLTGFLTRYNDANGATFVLEVGRTTFHLDFAGNRDLERLAEKLAGSNVQVAGPISIQQGPAISETYNVRVSDIDPVAGPIINLNLLTIVAARGTLSFDSASPNGELTGVELHINGTAFPLDFGSGGGAGDNRKLLAMVKGLNGKSVILTGEINVDFSLSVIYVRTLQPADPVTESAPPDKPVQKSPVVSDQTTQSKPSVPVESAQKSSVAVSDLRSDATLSDRSAPTSSSDLGTAPLANTASNTAKSTLVQLSPAPLPADGRTDPSSTEGTGDDTARSMNSSTPRPLAGALGKPRLAEDWLGPTI
jgi:hypothetical protein